MWCALCRSDETLRKFEENKCKKCGHQRISGKCYTRNCPEYKKQYNSPFNSSNSGSGFRKGKCPECGRSNTIINPETGLCNNCSMAKLRRMIQAMIKEEGLKEGQIEWERIKPQIEEVVRRLKQSGEREVAEIVEKNIETIESDLYPNRNNKGGSVWIWVLVIVGVVAVGTIGLVLWRKKKK